MVKFVKDLILGEPALLFGILSTASIAALTVWEEAPLWFGITAVVVNGLGTFYVRQTSEPTNV